MRLNLTIAIVLIARSLSTASPGDSSSLTTTSLADPDFLSSGLSWSTAFMPCARIGGTIPFRRLQVGGMFEARSEERFNQALLPNHNWRGIGSADIRLIRGSVGPVKVLASAAYKHESAHATMGIHEPTDKAYELVYDETYRRMNLNSANLIAECSMPLRRSRMKTCAAYNFYFLSKNTPELPGSRLTEGNGFSLGLEWSSPIGKRGGWYLSVHDRLILRSTATDTGSVYKGNGENLRSAVVRYPVINDVNTVAVKTGCSVLLRSSRRTAGLYIRFLYGNPYGYVDSRDTRRQFSGGVEIY